MRNFISIFSFVFLALLTACANFNSIHRDNTVSKTRGEIVFTDAKQRGIISNPVKETVVTKTTVVDGKTVSEEKELQRRLRMCSEAAPDVFSAYAFSAAAKVAAKVAEKSGQGEFSLSSAENASTIARTQTINMLRELMFRTCERYLNGAIDADELVVQAARDQRVMVSILAIEQLTGVYWQPIAALLSASQASTGGPTDETVKLVADAKAKKDKAASDAAAADTKAKELRKEAEKMAPSSKTCAENDAAEDGDAAKKAKCKEAKDKEDEAEKLKKTAETEESHYKTVKDLADQLGGTATSAQGRAQFHPASYPALQAKNMPAIAGAVERIVSETFAFDEVEMTCVVALRNGATAANVALYEKCIELLDRAAAASSEKIQRNIELRKAAVSVATKNSIRRDLIVRCAFAPGEKPEDEGSKLKTIINTAKSDLQPADPRIGVYNALGIYTDAEKFREYLNTVDGEALKTLADAAIEECSD